MKKIIKNFNNLTKKTISLVENKTNNIFHISSFNKYLISFIGILFIYLFYLLIPILYEKNWVQKTIESKILNEFKINLSSSADISYRILPAPHFLVKNSKVSINGSKNQKATADIKNLKIFISQKNFFNKEKINFKELVIDKANFSFLKNELKILTNFSNKQFSNKKIIINNSNIFFKDNSNEIITIILADKAALFFDDEKQLNLFDLKGSIFGVPFVFEFNSKNKNPIIKKINFNVKSLKLNIFNEIIKKRNKNKYGRFFISFLNSTIKTKYTMKEQKITFVSYNSKIAGSIVDYNGLLSINPLDLALNIDLGDYKISQIFNPNSILKEFIKSGLLFNENLSLDVQLTTNTNIYDEIFQNAEINFNVVNGKINLDDTKFINRKIGTLDLDNSNLFLEKNELILNTNILINIKNSKNLFSFLGTDKLSRKDIKKILINLDYNFSSKQIRFYKIEIDNKDVSDEFLNIIDRFNNNELNNLIKSRRLINKLLGIYKG